MFRIFIATVLALLAIPDVRAAERELLVLKSHKGKVFSAEFSADGKRILTCGADDTARLWDVDTGKELMAFHHPAKNPQPFADAHLAIARLSPDAQRVLTITSNSFNQEAGAEVGSRSSSIGADLHENDAARLWDANTGKVISEWTADKFPQTAIESPFNVAFSPDGKFVATSFGSQIDTKVRIHETKLGKEVCRLEGHALAVVDVAFSPDGKLVATASHDKTVCLWDTDTGKLIRTFKGHTCGITSLSFSPDSRKLLTTGAGSTHRFEATPNSVSSGSSSNTETMEDVFARMWDVTTGAQILARGWKEPEEKAPEIKIGPIGIRVEVKSTGPKGYVRLAKFSPDGKQFLTAGVVGNVVGDDDRHPTVWNATTGKRIATLKGDAFRDVFAATFSPNGERVVAGGKAGVVRLWNATTGKELFVVGTHTKAVRTIVFNSTGTRLLTASDDGSAKVWDVREEP